MANTELQFVKSNKKKLTIITNLYPLPWELNRATFNKQQFDQLDDSFDIAILIPVAFMVWLKHRKDIKQSTKKRYVPYFYLPKFGRRFYSIFLFLSILLHSGFWLKKRANDILFASWAFPEAVATKWLSQLFNCQFFFKVHGTDINIHGKIPEKAKQILSASEHASGIVSVSEALKDEMIEMGIDGKKVQVIYNGVNHQLFGTIEQQTQQEDYILFVGNLKREKGVFELINGFAAIQQKVTNIRLKIAGPGGLKGQLERETKQLSISDKVDFLGAVNHQDISLLMKNATLIALPSYNEGVPNVLLEAMACGKPVLATKVGGIPEVVKTGVCGILIAPKSEQQVAIGLTKVLSQSWSANEIEKHSQQFSWQKNKQELIELLSSTPK